MKYISVSWNLHWCGIFQWVLVIQPKSWSLGHCSCPLSVWFSLQIHKTVCQFVKKEQYYIYFVEKFPHRLLLGKKNNFFSPSLIILCSSYPPSGCFYAMYVEHVKIIIFSGEDTQVNGSSIKYFQLKNL